MKEQVQSKKGNNKGSTKVEVTAWGESSDESLDDDDDERALMAIGESDEETEVIVIHLKDKIKFLSKERLSELLLDLIDEYEDVSNEKEQLSKECVILKAKSSDTLSWLQEHHSSNIRGFGFGNSAPKWDPKRKYLTLLENKIFTHSGNTGHYKSECTAKEKVQVKRSSQIWYMDSGCSKHMTRSKNRFLSLEDLKGGNVSFENGKKGEIIGVGKR
ncbi:uncharacterized protein [Nicotiana tomentosiformis]|uniref:uncharacterized protein n=1 Tax=Nicotiana tomentosiformis TaxID=4098 RepID=UPI00388C7FC0